MKEMENAVAVTDATVDIAMIFSQSWVVNRQDTNDLLQHEQGHYDITALGAREFYNALISLTAQSVRELQIKVTTAHTRYQGKINSANIRYDNQTNHGSNRQAQHRWDQAIANEKQNSNGSIDNLP